MAPWEAPHFQPHTHTTHPKNTLTCHVHVFRKCRGHMILVRMRKGGKGRYEGIGGNMLKIHSILV